MRNKKFIIPITITALLAAIFLPIIFMGYSALKNAEAEFAAQNYASAAKSFEQAARLLPWRDELWEKAGIAAARNGKQDQAIDFFKQAPTLSAEGWMWFGYSYYQISDFPSSINALEESLQLDSLPSAYNLLALIYRQQKNWAAERNVLENQLRMDAGDVYTYYRLGLLLTVLEPEQALTNLMFASSLDPEFDPAVQTLRAALNLSSTQPDASQQMVTIGRSLGLVQEWDLSAAAFEKAITLDAENAEAWAWLGEAKQQTGGDGRAELDQAVALDHTSVVVRALRGLYWNRQEKYPQMLAEYLLAAEYEPTNPAWHAELGNAYFKRGDLVAALAAYQRATELAPNESTYWRLLAVFCAENGAQLEDVGLPAAQKAVNLAPNDPLTLDALGWAYLSSGRYANAEQTLLDVVARFPDHLPAHIHLALTYLAQGSRAAAFDKLTYVQSADPNGADGEMAKQLLKKYFP
ncbi:MAG: tetratricopeptide repeat protein [Anaerolineales bacterium]|nr:tetratricopeptide repeat protein [Anaerolineales bacterium]